MKLVAVVRINNPLTTHYLPIILFKWLSCFSTLKWVYVNYEFAYRTDNDRVCVASYYWAKTESSTISVNTCRVFDLLFSDFAQR